MSRSALTPARGSVALPRGERPSSLPARPAAPCGPRRRPITPASVQGGSRAARAEASADPPLTPPPPQPLPHSYRRLVARGVGSSFREVAKVTSLPLGAPALGEVLVQVGHVGINGGCETFRVRGEGGFRGNTGKEDFPLGAEGVGTVVAAGDGVEGVGMGQAVAFLGGGFSEFVCLPEAMVFPVPAATAEWAAATISGVTASVALHETAGVREGDRVLVTAAAGGTGHFAVQIAKLAGCHVIGTCGGPRKAAVLRDLGVDRVVDHTREDLGEVLAAEYPGGVDVAYEGVGGGMLKAAMANLAPGGRLLMVGYISQYPHMGDSHCSNDAEDMFWNSRTVQIGGGRLIRGNVWPKDRALVQKGKERVFEMVREDRIRVLLDKEHFDGLDSIPDAVDHMLSGATVGKVCVAVSRRE